MAFRREWWSSNASPAGSSSQPGQPLKSSSSKGKGGSGNGCDTSTTFNTATAYSFGERSSSAFRNSSHKDLSASSKTRSCASRRIVMSNRNFWNSKLSGSSGSFSGAIRAAAFSFRRAARLAPPALVEHAATTSCTARKSWLSCGRKPPSTWVSYLYDEDQTSRDEDPAWAHAELDCWRRPLEGSTPNARTLTGKVSARNAVLLPRGSHELDRRVEIGAALRSTRHSHHAPRFRARLALGRR